MAKSDFLGNICTKWNHKILTSEQKRFFHSFRKKRKGSRNRTPESLSRKKSSNEVPTPKQSSSKPVSSQGDPSDSGSC